MNISITPAPADNRRVIRYTTAQLRAGLDITDANPGIYWNAAEDVFVLCEPYDVDPDAWDWNGCVYNRDGGVVGDLEDFPNTLIWERINATMTFQSFR